MKLVSNNNQLVMKNLLVSLLLLVSISSIGQVTYKTSAIADPTLGQIVITDLSGSNLDPEALQPSQLIKLRIPVSNLNTNTKIPAGSAKIKIGFGSKLQLDPTFDMNSSGLGSYFHWTSSSIGGQTEILGDLIGELPVDMQSILVTFKVKTAALGKSTITANFLVTNHNTESILSDENPSNNTSYLQYIIAERPTAPPVVSISDVARGACTINVVFGSDREINLSRYDVEVSKDGINYVKVSEVSAANQLSYRASFPLTPQIEAQTLLVRVKSVDMDGNYRYSTAVSVTGTCEKVLPWGLNVYPNPATDVKSVVITAGSGEFNGKYKVTMFDVTGQLIKTAEMQLDHTTKFTYNFGVIASGKYLINLVNVDGSQSGTLKLEKL